MGHLTTIRRATLALLTGLALTGFAACSAIGVGGGGNEGGVPLEVRVNNDLRASQQVSVSLHNTTGDQRTLGRVSAGETRSFEITADQGSDIRYRLMAEPVRGETILSRDVRVRENSILSWSLQDNEIEVFEARDQDGS